MRNTTTISGSFGSFEADQKTGFVVSGGDSYPTVFQVDLYEYKKYWNVSELPKHGIDILNVAYWDNNGEYIEAALLWREEIKYMQSIED